jgi:hypothetical protein
MITELRTSESHSHNFNRNVGSGALLGIQEMADRNPMAIGRSQAKLA